MRFHFFSCDQDPDDQRSGRSPIQLLARGSSFRCMCRAERRSNVRLKGWQRLSLNKLTGVMRLALLGWKDLGTARYAGIMIAITVA